MQYIGKIDKSKLGKYKEKILTEDVILTDERTKHIKERHPGDYDKYIKQIPNIIKEPDYILEDKDNKDTIIILKSIMERKRKIQVVVKLHTNIKENNKSNSIITFWHLRERSYMSTIRNNKIIYKKLDMNV